MEDVEMSLAKRTLVYERAPLLLTTLATFVHIHLEIHYYDQTVLRNNDKLISTH